MLWPVSENILIHIKEKLKMAILSRPKALLLPLPVTLATCRAQKGNSSTDNIIPLAWVGIVEYNPPMVNIVIGRGKYSAKVINQTREFGLCVATVEMMDKVDACGYSHGDNVDKFKLTGLEKFPARKIDVSLIKHCPVCLECIVRDVAELKTHDMYIAEVVLTHVDDSCVVPGRMPIGRENIIDDSDIDLGTSNILSYGDEMYWKLGEKLENLYYSKKKQAKK
jgi:flavin reductase (DIM6/NTAB) family NADH-FMN oxidoreductase RutF